MRPDGGSELGRRRTGIRASESGDQLVLTGADGRSHALNPTARAVWELCDGTTSVDEMVLAVCELSPVDPEGVRADVWLLLTELEARGLIERAPVQVGSGK